MIDERNRLCAVQTSTGLPTDYDVYRLKCSTFKTESRLFHRLRKEHVLGYAHQSSSTLYKHMRRLHKKSTPISSLIRPVSSYATNPLNIVEALSSLLLSVFTQSVSSTPLVSKYKNSLPTDTDVLKTMYSTPCFTPTYLHP